MTWYQKFIHNQTLRRITVLLSVCLIFWLFQRMLSLFLLTFIFTFLITRLVNMIKRHINIKPVFIVVPTYAIIVGLIYYAVVHYVPLIVKQSMLLVDRVYKFYHSSAIDKNQLILFLNHCFSQLNLIGQLKGSFSKVLTYIGGISTTGVMFFFALLLSFFFALETKQLKHFGTELTHSKFGWYFSDIAYFGKKFVSTFGFVIEAQILIALVNTTLTVITLSFMKMPNVPSLGVMVFLLSMIPVAGVIISLIPLSIIGYSIGGIRYVIYILILILCIHALEAYVLNPRFMAMKTKLPIFCTFIVLLIAERLLGTWGLIVGIPIFTFLLDILGVQSIGKPMRKIKTKHS